MSGGQEKNFSTLGPKLRGSKAQQYYGDKQRQIRTELIDYLKLEKIMFSTEQRKNFRDGSQKN